MSEQDNAEPFLIVAALWTKGDQAEAVAEALHDFAEPEGFARGAAVSFSKRTADDWEFQRTMWKLDLAEANERNLEPSPMLSSQESSNT